MPLVVVAAAAAVLLAQAAVGKLRRPAPTARALLALAGTVGLRPRPLHALRAARVLAVAEVTVVAAVLLLPAALGESLLAATYAGFAVVVLTQLRIGNDDENDGASCGCFGTEVPLGPGHAVLDAVLAAAAAVTAFGGSSLASSLASELAPTDLRRATLLGLSLLVAGLAWAAFAVLPAQQEQVRASARVRTA